MNKYYRIFLTALLMTVAAPSPAVLTIEVNRGVEAAIPIAVVPFGGDGAAEINESLMRPSAVIAADLTRSGKFAPLPHKDFVSTPSELKSVQYKDWRLVKAEALVIGTVTIADDGRFEVRFRLLDVFQEKQLAGRKFVVKQSRLRRVAHQISDIVYKTMLGKPGAFDTRIAYITVEDAQPKKIYHLQIADSDGHNPQTILKSPYPILSPAWSPDGNHLAYVSFENKRSTIYLQALWSGAREQVAAHDGINSAPAWSPDGRRLAMTLSRDGNAEIYIYHLTEKKLRRLTHHTAIDTEAAWSPDGRMIVFTSSRAGSPQIYQVATGGDIAARRVTFEGDYNAGATFSGDGKSLALITNRGNGFRVGLYSFESRTLTELTDTRHDESPTFSPNDEMVMYATRSDGRDVLAAVSVDGKVRHLIHLPGGTVREPAWSPFNK